VAKTNSSKAGTVFRQVAALPVRRRDGKTEVCLITTRTSARWTVPKGWPMKGRKDFTAARIEAEQEAGLVGKVGKEPIGTFSYWKRYEDHFDFVEVTVYPLDVSKTLPTWKEQAERQVQWLEPSDASTIVVEPGLAAILIKMDRG
jgi:8-oxo-dGTP pyrophosphatase MutT (NUDIX family)